MRNLEFAVRRAARAALPLCLLAVSGTASAGFVYAPAAKPNPAPSVNLTGYQLISAPAVIQVGRGRVRVAKGFFHEAPLAMVLAGLVPKGWHVYGKEVSWSCPVSWTGPSPWIAALREVMRRSGAGARVIWSRQVVLVKPRRALVAHSCQAPLLVGAHHIHRLKAGGGRPGSHLVGAPLQVTPAHRVWIAHTGTGRTIRSTLMEWGRIAHVRVFWHTNKDWPIVAPAVFSGTFAQAVNQMLASVNREGAGLRGVLFSNHVLVVTHHRKGRSQ